MDSTWKWGFHSNLENEALSNDWITPPKIEFFENFLTSEKQKHQTSSISMRLPARFSMLRFENPAKSLRSTKRSMFSLKFSSFRDSRIELSASVGNVSKKLLFKLSRATLFLPKTPGSSDFNAFLLRSSSSRNFWSCEMDHIYKIYLNLNICICQY